MSILDLDLDPEAPADHVPAIRWAAERLNAIAVQSISATNWAATYRVEGREAVGYLKLLPGIQHAQADRIRHLADAFSDAVPAVLAVEPDAGWILLADHGGHASDHSDDQVVATATAYARLQAAATQRPALLRSLRRGGLDHAVDELLRFLGADQLPVAQPAPAVAAEHFIGAADARRYAELIGSRAALLRAHVASAATLPDTLSHGDLHMGNVAVRDDGSIVIFDWDELAVGPAGLSLQGLLGGCTRAHLILARMADGRPVGDSLDSQVLRAYVDTLADRGYADEATLLSALPGALAAGQMRFISSFGRYPGEASVDAAGRTLRQRLSDLLDLCDWLCARDETMALAQADDYRGRGEHERAHRLVQDRLAREPQRVDLLVRYGQGALTLGQAEEAREAFEAALAAEPGHGEARIGRVHALLELGQLDAALEACAARRRRAPSSAALSALAERIRSWIAIRDAGALPRVALSDDERDTARLAPGTRRFVADLFRRQGAVQLDNVYAIEQIATLQKAFLEQQGEHLAQPERPDVLQVGDQRYMLTMALEGAFGDSAFVANGLTLPIMREILGSDCILGAYTAVVSLPGSADQEPHKDHTPLFEESGWKLPMPSFCAQVIVPLLALDAVTGATRIFAGSQRSGLRNAVADIAPHDPEVPLGSCLLLDYSVAHYGRGNRSDQIRPIINLIYARPWFRDIRNYNLQPPLRFTPAFYDTAPPEVRQLIGWWQAERAAAAASMR